MAGRRTFVLHVYADGPARLEEVSTGRTARVEDLDDLAGQVRRWMDHSGSDLDPGQDPGLQR